MVLRMTRWLMAALLCLVVWPGISYGQSSELMEAFNSYNALYQQGRYSDAEPHAKEALRLGTDEFGPNDPVTADLLNNLAELYQDRARR